jgi:hypothetical protein
VQLDIIAPDEIKRTRHRLKENTPMKKLMTLMLGMSLLFGTVSVVFGQDPPKKEDTTKKTKKKTSKKKEETPKKDGGK